MWTSINKKYFIFLSIILGIGLVLGFIYVAFLSNDSKLLIETSFQNFLQDLSNIRINLISTHIFILPLLLIASFLVIGIPLGIIYLLYNGFLIGFSLDNFIIVGGFKGFIFGLIYNIITKLVYLFLLIMLITTLIKISINIINYLVKKNRFYKDKIIVLFKKALMCIILIILNDIILYFIGNNLINIFNFLVI